MTALGPIDADNLRLILPRAETQTQARPWRSGQVIRALVIEVLAGDHHRLGQAQTEPVQTPGGPGPPEEPTRELVLGGQEAAALAALQVRGHA